MVLTTQTLYQPEEPQRPVGLYGRKPGHIPTGLRDFTWYVAGALPKPPLSVKVPVPPAGWGMDGNDQVGDCGIAGTHHGEMAVDIDTSTPLLKVTDQQLIQYYFTYTGGADVGVVLADFLAYVKKHTFFSRKLTAYAPVSITDYATLQFVVNAYGYAYTGIVVTDLMEQAFSNRQPWTAADAANGQVLGGHCVPIVGYDSKYLYVITWGAVQAIEYSAWHLVAEEAWACIWGEIPAAGLSGHGVNLAALEADLAKLTR